MKSRFFSLCQAVSALIIGCVVYIIFRRDTFLHSFLPFLRNNTLSKASFFGDDIFRYYLPDFLWGYSLTAALYALYPPIKKRTSCLPVILSAFVGFVFELLQYFHIFSGTGDPIDVLIYLCAAIVAYKFIQSHLKRRQKS